MATFVFLHGAGGRGSDGQLVADRLREQGHETVLVDLPCEEPVGLDAYAQTAIDAIGGRSDIILVAHSLGGLTAPVVASRIPVEAMVFVTAMVPLPGERGSEWWGNVGHEAAFEAQGLPDQTDETVYVNEVPAEVLATAEPPRDQTGEVLDDPSPIKAWPDVPTRFLVCRDDHFFPAAWMTDVVRQRLGIEPEVISGDHCPYLSHPVSTADAIERAWRDRASAPPVVLAPSPA